MPNPAKVGIQQRFSNLANFTAVCVANAESVANPQRTQRLFNRMKHGHDAYSRTHSPSG